MSGRRTLDGKVLCDWVAERHGLIPMDRADGIDLRSERGTWIASRFASARTLGRIMGRSEDTVRQWRAGKGINIWTADEVAVHLGVHPSAIWGDEWWSIPDRDPNRIDRRPRRRRKGAVA